jgi:hypothetical protein
MGTQAPTKPVEDTISKVDNELALGADLEFQRKWWKFEFTIWVIFTIFVIMDLLGCFGRGPLANAQYKVSDGSATVHYERIERFATPSVMTINFGQDVIHDGKVQLWVSEDLVKSLGNQRVVPQPESSKVGEGGILYTFPASVIPASAEFALQPTGPGLMKLQMRVPGHETANLRIIVMP